MRPRPVRGVPAAMGNAPWRCLPAARYAAPMTEQEACERLAECVTKAEALLAIVDAELASAVEHEAYSARRARLLVARSELRHIRDTVRDVRQSAQP